MWGVGQLSVNHVGQFSIDFIHPPAHPPIATSQGTDFCYW